VWLQAKTLFCLNNRYLRVLHPTSEVSLFGASFKVML